MAKRKPRNSEVKNIEETREYKVLEEYHDQDGHGLTANALCYLTKQDWKTVRHNLTRFTGAIQFDVNYCDQVNAPIFFIQRYCVFGENIITQFQPQQLALADRIIAKYPPTKYAGSLDETGQKTLTFFLIDDEDYYGNDDYEGCDDPSCCPPPPKRNKKALAKEKARENRKLVRLLKASWR